ncbi:hypothetical protein HY991_05985 [Candidatus Micrarchaeota archaeon]|nr:hypothetical protein [Candidatus Micrarchaeota archaeon]
MKSQVSMEYLAIVAFAVVSVLLVWVYVSMSMGDTRTRYQLALAENAVSKLKEAVDLVATQGPPARHPVSIYVPEDVKSLECKGRLITLTLYTQAGETPVYGDTIGSFKYPDATTDNGCRDIQTFSGNRQLLVSAEWVDALNPNPPPATIKIINVSVQAVG